MIQQAFVEIAEAMARSAHAGQFDKSGVDYITHPARVAERVLRQGGADEAVAAAWLHDVLEDCDVSAADLAAAGIPDAVIDAVQAVTKIDGEAPEDYCARILASPTALRVKRADIDDNTDPARTALLPEATRERLAAKYARTRHLLGLDTDMDTGTGQ
ncbi:HD domain-containing protein [Paeniglutamicibacter sp. NPDC091659]|uniref:HD domain-containing protein n=1 Tax=Paeniglutamicibacter sp. NPDC091659 TaxID=3364389 RepID=UPI00381EA937